MISGHHDSGRTGTRHALLIGGFAAILLYFVWVQIGGPNGYRVEQELMFEHQALTQRLDSLQQQQEALKRDESALRYDGANADLLEEHIRGVLGYHHRDEHLILLPPR